MPAIKQSLLEPNNINCFGYGFLTCDCGGGVCLCGLDGEDCPGCSGCQDYDDEDKDENKGAIAHE